MPRTPPVSVNGRAPGSLPDDPPEPALVRKTVRFDLAPETYARLRQIQAALAQERGRQLDADQLITTLCDAVLAPEPREPDHAGRAKFQVATLVCEPARRGFDHGRSPNPEAPVPEMC